MKGKILIYLQFVGNNDSREPNPRDSQLLVVVITWILTAGNVGLINRSNEPFLFP